MKFSKETKKYFLEELKGNITNNFNFTIKSLHQQSSILEGPLKICAQCKLPLTSSICQICKADNKFPSQTKFIQSFVYKEPVEQDQKMEDSMILCIDLSGSMSCTYRSKYKKVNEELVCRILGEKNFQFLKKKIGLQKVMNNYTVYQMLLNQGESARNIVQMVKMEETNKYGSSSKNKEVQKQKQKEEVEQYISRKQIIEITTSKCLAIMKSRNPNTQITVVYFNDTIQIPTNNFNDKLIIHDIQNKTVEEMINLGTEYATQISKQKASMLGQNLAMHLTKAVQNGQTALGPALAFSLGLAKAFHHSLTQIIVVTDGMSNIGFGQTQNELEQELTKKFYSELALTYAKPLNCVVDVVTFEDCCIGYDQLDQLVEFTGGIPCQIQFTEEGGEKTVTQDTFSNISFRMTTAFCEYTSQLCFQTKTIIYCNNEKIKLAIPNQLKPFVEVDKGNFIILKIGIRSSSSSFHINFSFPNEVEQFEGTLKFLVINQFKRNNKKNITVTTQKLKVTKGTKAQAQKEQANSLQKEIKQKLKPRQIFEEDLNEYGSISIKIEENESIVNSLDKQLLQKFKMKKEMLETEYKNIDKLAKEKISMRSRAQKTLQAQQDDFDDGFM